MGYISGHFVILLELSIDEIYQTGKDTRYICILAVSLSLVRNAVTVTGDLLMVLDHSLEDPYRVLGVDIDATPEEVRRAFRKKAARIHPDKAPFERRQRATQEFQQLSCAFEALSDAEVRHSLSSGI